MAKNKPLEVVTTKVACKMLGCSRNHFYRKFIPQLTELEKINNRRFYLLSEVKNLVEIEKGLKPNYKIIDK